VLIDVPVLNGVSEKDIARNIAIDETDAVAVGGAGLVVFRWCNVFGH